MKEFAFFKDETDYKGFLIRKESIKMDTMEIEPVNKLPEKKTAKEILGFNGIWSHYWRYTHNLQKKK